MSPQEDAVFVAAVAIVLEHEGGYQNDYEDPGNWTGGRVGRGALKGTKFGISAATYPELDIAELTPNDAREIYFRDWWARYGYGQLAPAVATKLLDLAVPAPRDAHRALQRACKACGTLNLDDDGVLGELTVAAANSHPASMLLAAFKEAFADYCRMVAAHYMALHGSPDPFLKGWLDRAYA